MMVNSIKILIYLHLEMIFLNIQDKQFVLFRIERFLESLHRKKKVLKRHSEQYKKVINQITFYKVIQQKLQQCQGDVEYSLFTEENENEFFYISMILCMRGHYRTLKSLCELRFTEDEKLHIELQKWLRRVIELDPTLFNDFWEMNSSHTRICPFSKSVDEELSFDSDDTVNLVKDLYRIWIQNLLNSFELLRDYESWRRKNFNNDKWIDCCQAQCNCYIERVEERLYRIICYNVFFDHYLHRHETPPRSYWFNKADSSFSRDN